MVAHNPRALIAALASLRVNALMPLNVDVGGTGVRVGRGRGLPQGSCTAPIFFGTIIDLVLRRCRDEFDSQGLGFRWGAEKEERLHAPGGPDVRTLAYADDVVLAARTA